MKIAIITGASAGMGKEFTIQLAEKNLYDEIWIIARRQELLEELANSINKKHNSNIIRPFCLDLGLKEQIFKLQEMLAQQSNLLGDNFTVSMLVNNAGFGIYGPFEESSVSRNMNMVDLNCTALTGLCGITIPFMKKDSIIINTASLASFIPLGNFSVYGATKAFVLSLSMALSAELKDKGIKVCALCPGPVSTEFANVASNGARKEVRHGVPAAKVVEHCLKKAFSGKRTAIYCFKWKFKATASRFVGRYAGARFTFKYSKRPHNPDL